MERFEYLTTLSGLIHWESRAKKGEEAIMALAHALSDIRDHLKEAAKDVSAEEREGFLIITKLRNPMRPKHAPIARKALGATSEFSRARDAQRRNAKVPATVSAAPSSASSIKEEQLAKGREWAEIVKLLSPYQEFEKIVARRHTLKIVTRQSEQNRLQANRK
jgi:hypothetical protein